MLTAALLVLLLLALLTGQLLGTFIGAVGLAVLTFGWGGSLSVLGNAVWNQFNSFTFTAIPTFILLGELLAATGLAQRVYGALAPLFARLPGKLLQTNIGICTVFSAISGSSTATTAVVGSIAYDELERRGYDRKLLIGSIAAGGTLGILIPPSVALMIYGAWQNVSVGKLFVAGLLPGLMLAGLFMLWIAIVAIARPQVAPDEERVPLGRAIVGSLQAWPILVLIAAILGTIFFGLATPTESAGLGVATVLVLALLYGELTWRRVWKALSNTVTTFSAIAFIVVGAIVLSQAVALTGLPKELLKAIAAAELSPTLVLLLVYLLYLVLGCFLGPVEMLLITLPFVFPLVTGLGYDPVWFGIVLVVLIEIGLLTPPLGINLFVVVAVARNRVGVGEAARACLPFWLLMLLSLALLTLLPEIALWLPSVARIAG